MNLYFAGPLFSQAEKTFNISLCETLESMGFRVFLPQRDGVERNKSPYDAMSPEERRVAMFELDRDKIFASDIFLFVLDGRVPDEGACVELGLAYAHREIARVKRVLVGLHTDARAAFMGAKLNPMLRVPMDYIAENEADLLVFLEAFSGGVKGSALR